MPYRNPAMAYQKMYMNSGQNKKIAKFEKWRLTSKSSKDVSWPQKKDIAT